MSVSRGTFRRCAKCGERSRSRNAGYCKEHHAEYMRQARARQIFMTPKQQELVVDALKAELRTGLLDKLEDRAARSLISRIESKKNAAEQQSGEITS